MIVPKALSEGEETLSLHLRANDIEFQREVEFATGHKYRWDFAWPEIMLAVEIQGGTKSGKSSHSRGAGFERDCRKHNLGVQLGWKCLLFTTDMVKSGEALNQVMLFLLRSGQPEYRCTL